MVMRNQLLSSEDHLKISEAVRIAELSTDGEIVTVMAQASDDYADTALRWASIITFLALGVVAAFPRVFESMLERFSGGWNHIYTTGELLALLSLFLGLKFGGSWAIIHLTPLRVWLTPGWIKHRRVDARARLLFATSAERRTVGRTGILIYLSAQEHRAEILADEAIATKVEPEVWGDALLALVSAAKEGRIADGIVASVEKVGVVLASHIPKSDGNPNEIPDRLIEL
jgi:putative membrane protein